MGLSGGPHGSKALFISEFAEAFQNVKCLKDARELLNVKRSQTLVVLDGNVMLNAIPGSIDTFLGYVGILTHQIKDACQAAAHVVVVFDEPAAMTTAKRDEQRRRDTVRQARVPQCSEDLVATIVNDNFTTNDLNTEGCNAKLLMEHRAARPRFFDAVCVALLKYFGDSLTGADWSLTFDGIDPRGADRGFGVPREAGVLSSDDAFWKPLLSRDVAIGEGDIKLTDVTRRVHKAALDKNAPVHGVVLNLVVTIDTDSFAIELLQQNRREIFLAENPEDTEFTVLCIKERSRKRAGDDFTTDAHYLCCDMQAFHELILDRMHGTKNLSDQAKKRQPAALALLAATIACCGCDFVEVKGMRADLALPVVCDVVRNNPEQLDAMACIFAPSEGDVLKSFSAVKFVILEYAKSLQNVPRMQKAQHNASNHCEAQILRALWTCSYWHQREFCDCSAWGFASTSG